MITAKTAHLITEMMGHGKRPWEIARILHLGHAEVQAFVSQNRAIETKVKVDPEAIELCRRRRAIEAHQARILEREAEWI